MDIDTRGGDWEAVNGSIDYLSWLLVGKNVSEGEALIDNLIRLSEFHLRGVVEDAEDIQAHHYRQASKITYHALTISKKFLGIDDPRLLDLHYSLVKQFYLQLAALERGGDTAYDLRAVAAGSKWVTSRRVVQSRYYNTDLGLLNNMRKIVIRGEKDSAESLAMIDLYTADWHLLFDQVQAKADYGNAFTRLQEAGVDRIELALLFAKAKILPIPTFHFSVSNALTSDYSVQIGQPIDLGKEANNYFYFQEWFDAMLVISFSSVAPTPGQASQKSLTKIRLHFCLDSLNKVSRWVGSRYRTNMSAAKELAVLESDEQLSIDAEPLDARLLHFRPRLKNGIARPFEVTLLY